MRLGQSSGVRPPKVGDALRASQWMKQAACVGQDPELFFAVGDSGPAVQQNAAAKAVCAGCPVRLRCLAWSLEARQSHGVHGGLTEDERRDLAARYFQERGEVAVS